MGKKLSAKGVRDNSECGYSCNRRIRKGLTEKVTFQYVKYMEKVREGATWIRARSVQAEGTVRTKVLKWVQQAAQYGWRGDLGIN